MSLVFRSDWIAVAVLALADALLAGAAGLHLIVTWRAFLFLAPALLVTLLLKALHRRKAGMAAEFIALNIATTMLFCIFTYACMAMSGPYADNALLAFDRGLGFDWQAGFRLATASPAVWQALNLIYYSIFFQAVFFAVLFGMMDRPDRLREVFRLLFAALVLTGLGAMLWPALGPFKLFHLEAYGPFLPDMEKLHARHLSFLLENLTGVIDFPSFHTTAALAYAYGFRRLGAVGWAMGAFNAAVLVTVPFVGGHYLADMLAGVGVFAASLALVRLLNRRSMKRAAVQDAGVAVAAV